jgi:hypothetical protein
MAWALREEPIARRHRPRSNSCSVAESSGLSAGQRLPSPITPAVIQEFAGSAPWRACSQPLLTAMLMMTTYDQSRPSEQPTLRMEKLRR